MTDTTCHMSISLDGFVAGPDQSREHTLGTRGLDRPPSAAGGCHRRAVARRRPRSARVRRGDIRRRRPVRFRARRGPPFPTGDAHLLSPGGVRPDTTMKYMILLYDNADMREIFSSRSDLMEEMAGLLEEIRQSGELVATEPLADPVQTKTVRPADGLPVVTDGPLVEAKEHFGGYLIVDCETNERAVEIAAKWPSARFAPIEVRPILDVGGAEL